MGKNDKFYNPSLGYLEVPQMVGEISNFVGEEPGRFYSVLIGTDSQGKRINGVSEIDFVTAIVVHRKGSGGRYFWRKERVIKKPVLREKIYTETLMSLDCAEHIVPLLRAAVSPAKYDLQIHIDVGALGPTRELIREVVGMVQGNGYIAKTKPESWAASSVADKHT
jgi:predicted RNase H-related nuclease YkuK (DUF458 family)